MMKNGKFQRRGAAKRGAGKSIAVLLVLVLVLGCAIGGTIAWLTDTTDEVQNTFTVGDVDIKLEEHAYNADNTSEITTTVSNSNTYHMIPGTTYAKDPTVTVLANSEDCYLYVKFETSGNTDLLTFTSALTTNEQGWTKLDGVDNVYYREVSKSTADQPFALIVGNKVEIADTLTKTDFANVTNPVLKYTAYAIQKANTGTAAEAWAKIPNK